ncbi:flagellar hook-associated protein FlgL [Pullulanibacillus sp. KACC 23026]|uniref:flagellar hook-associated protein FlgL n=1 Tax=Pullulanibacillus sp. KACC 23026 TaxID=3028315 RepID=UPI0023AF5DA0|nr:flagellar hook-associated protein FlgL [Pullulanibacillus sp. KACC 23026]WEG11246.1 flagellar hook-associated protein FlgL [Pullulanibacillus sp. KACC 23026]
MSTRVTQGMMSQTMLYNLQQNNSLMNKLQQQAATGEKISRPSDDPVVAVRGMYYQSTLTDIDQYKKNADDGYSWMSSTDDALDQVNQVLQRVRELTVQGQNGTNTQSDKEAIAQEVDQLKDQLGEIANSQIAGRYIFAGTDTSTAPYGTDPNNPDSEATFLSDNEQQLQVQVGQNTPIPINVSGKDVFNNNGQGGVFQVLSDIVSDFSSSDGSTTSDHLADLDSQIDNVLQLRSDLGARMNRMQLSQSRLDGLETSTTDLLSKNSDVDMASVYTDLKSQETVQSAALEIGARIIQPTLADFLK